MKSSREAKERSFTEHLEMFITSRDEVHGQELVSLGLVPAKEGYTG